MIRPISQFLDTEKKETKRNKWQLIYCFNNHSLTQSDFHSIKLNATCAKNDLNQHSSQNIKSLNKYNVNK